MKKSKNMVNATKKFDSMKAYLLEEAVALVKDMKYSKFDDKGIPTSISFIGDLYKDGELVAVARSYQRGTGWHKRYPPKFQ